MHVKRCEPSVAVNIHSVSRTTTIEDEAVQSARDLPSRLNARASARALDPVEVRENVADGSLHVTVPESA